MEHFCKVIMAGRATADPVNRSNPARRSLASFGFVFNDKYQLPSGDWQDRPMFIDVEADGDLAGDVLEHVSRGTALLVEGKLRLDEWTDAQQVKHRRHKIVLQNFRILERRPPKNSESVKQAIEYPPSEPEII